MVRVFFLLLFFPGTLCAQALYTFSRISTEQGMGLASDNVFAACQDSKGFIWVGTSNGLQRFDGKRFVKLNLTRPENRHLLWADIGQLLMADSARLWVYIPTLDEIGLFDIRKTSYERIPVEPTRKAFSQSARRLWMDSRGNTFLLLPDQEILRFHPAKRKFVQDSSIVLPEGWRPGLHLFEDRPRGRIWIPCVDSGFAVWDIRSGKVFTRRHNPERIPLLDNPAFLTDLLEIHIDRERRHWVFYWSGRQRRQCFDEQGREIKSITGLDDQSRYPRMHRFFESAAGALWIYGSSLLYSYDRPTRKFADYPPGFSATGIQYRQVHHMMEDRDGNLWLSTDNGLFYTASGSGNPSVMNKVFDADEREVEITDILQLPGGGYWLSTWGEGIIGLDDRFAEVPVPIMQQHPPFGDAVWKDYMRAWTLYQHNDGTIWVGCQDGRYMIHDPRTGRTSFHLLKEAEGSPIRQIARARNGDLFFATHRRGHIIRFDGKRYATVQIFETTIPKILVDHDGLLWVMTFNKGLYCLSEDGSTVLKHITADSNGLYSNTGYDIEQLNDSVLAVAAGALHLVNTRTGAVSRRSFDDGLPSNSLRCIQKDGSGNLWLITLSGLCRYNPKTGRFTPFERKDGITVSTVTRNAGFLNREGRILFAGSNALFSFNPSRFESNRRPPDVTITEMRLFNQVLPVDSIMALPFARFKPGQNTFRFYFSSLSYAQNELLTYYYKLDGVHREWIMADRLGTVDFSLLPPGDYTFSIYAVNHEGLRSANTTQIRFSIQPHFWQTWWFFGILAAIISGLGYYMHRLRVHKLLAVEAVRSKVARDLHDDVGSTLSTINILGAMAKTKLHADTVKTGEYISKITENSQRMMEAMDDIVWSIKPDNDTVQKMMVRMKEFALGVLEAKDIAVQMKLGEDVGAVKLNMEARRNLFLIFKEAVNNIAKYSRASHVSIHIACHQKRLVLTIRDDGVGFDVEKADGNGLGNMEKRTVALNGRFQLITRPGEGTSITVNIPVG